MILYYIILANFFRFFGISLIFAAVMNIDTNYNLTFYV